ncbi:MAG: tRNA (N6-threonylcarbamoyladenosine(37)-N6)-methyltransferase TrmO, partial [Clostridia bacterium]|nr:tRNA (N6-threonylcarbamoyladenosine(37)-N6)-methyltransferase TrmO [Clostridia bacterium]
YLPFSDSHPEARFSFAREHLEDALSVELAPELASAFPAEKHSALLEILRQDPRPSYQEDPNRIYGFFFAGFEIRFRVEAGVLTVVSIEKKEPSKKN